ncbi:MAG: phosphoribosylaminoimidazole carboxylase [Nitrososphaeria archaeon]
MARERGPRVGILGGGQLGWMMVLEGRRLGISFGVLDPDAGAPAARIADRAFRPGEGAELASWSDVVTYEFENAEAEAAEIAEAAGKLRPGLRPLLAKRNRLLEKRLFVELGIPTADFRPAGSPREVEGVPLERGVRGRQGPGRGVRREGRALPEESRGRRVHPLELPRARGGDGGHPGGDLSHSCALEVGRGGGLPGGREPQRGRDPPVQHCARAGRGGRRGRVQGGGPPGQVHGLRRRACGRVPRVGRRRVLANEFAPRVHNTGHWSLCGAATSQFENHLRAILDMPLGSTEILRPTGIVNILGISRDELPVRDILSVPGARLWWYGKAEARPGRKMGHACVVAGSDEELRRRLRELMAAIYGDFPPSAAASVGAGALESEISHLSRSADA